MFKPFYLYLIKNAAGGLDQVATNYDSIRGSQNLLLFVNSPAPTFHYNDTATIVKVYEPLSFKNMK